MFALKCLRAVGKHLNFFLPITNPKTRLLIQAMTWAFACYGLDIRWKGQEEVWLRFVEGNPKSDPTI